LEIHFRGPDEEEWQKNRPTKTAGKIQTISRRVEPRNRPDDPNIQIYPVRGKDRTDYITMGWTTGQGTDDKRTKKEGGVAIWRL